MKTIKTTSLMTAFSASAKKSGKRIGFVPTMGHLHEGHLSLIKAAKKANDVVVVSIFVNPIQFGPKEDLKSYPRDTAGDLKLLRSLKVDAVFLPTSKEMFPKGFSTFVSLPDLSRGLCGRKRPIHFRGVATIVAKLFEIIAPNVAYFGLKDYQQFVMIKRMARDLNMHVQVVGRPTVRESSGLAMSSRNLYLTLPERESAGVLYKALRLAKDMVRNGSRDNGKMIAAMSGLVSSVKPKVEIEYIEICDPQNLERKRSMSGPALIALAARIGRTRLIDSIIIR